MGRYLTPMSTRKAWALWRTGPHVPWHLVDLFSSRRDAEDAASQLKSDMHTDGIVIRHLEMAPPVMKWERGRKD